MTKNKNFINAQQDTLDNLDALQISLERCVEEGMIDSESTYYNELSDLIDEAKLAKTWNELEEVITLAKTLETDIDAWMSMHGRTTISMPWPSQTENEP